LATAKLLLAKSTGFADDQVDLAKSIALNNDCRLCASSAALHPHNIGRSADFERMRATVPGWLQLRDRCLGLTAERRSKHWQTIRKASTQSQLDQAPP
jgi:hypothetical protein